MTAYLLLLGTGYSTAESVLKLIGLIVLCFVIIAASFFTTRFIGRRQQGAYAGSNFQSLDVYRISPNKYLQLIKVGEHYIVIAVSKDGITKIAELDESEVKQKEPQAPGVTFKEVLDKIRNKTK